MLIDLHNHVLPEVDDGAQSLDVSMKMIKTAFQQGITDIVNTIHFQHPKMSMKPICMDEINSKLDSLKRKVESTQMHIKFHLGAEVFFLPNLVQLIDNPICTLGNGKYMLIEFPMRKLPRRYREVLFDLKMNGTTPIIAHPERNMEIQGNLNIVRELIDAGCLMQLDGGSINGTLGPSAYKSAKEIVVNELYHLVGSDAHNDGRRNFCLDMALQNINQLTNIKFSNSLISNAYKVINGEYISENINMTKSYQTSLVERIRNKIWKLI